MPINTASVSVVIPLYNKEGTIDACLQSVFAQTVVPEKIIVVDDKSTDQSVEKVRQLAGRYDSLKLVALQHNAGVSAARNLGASMATTEFIAFLDADDCWDPQFIEKVLAQLQEGNSNFGASYRSHFDTRKGATIQGDTDLADRNPKDFDRRFWSIIYPYLPVNSSCNLIRTRSFNDAGGFPVGMSNYEDFLFWSRLWARNHFVFVNEKLSTINKNGEGASARSASGRDVGRLISGLFLSLVYSIQARRPGSLDLVKFIIRICIGQLRSRSVRKLRQYIGRK